MICTSPAGPLVEIHMDYLERPARRGFVVIGEDGTMEWEGEAGRLTVRRRDQEAPQRPIRPPLGSSATTCSWTRYAMSCGTGRDRTERAYPPDGWPRCPGCCRCRQALDSNPGGSGLGEDRDPFDLAGRVAIVTGATGMLGRECADELARAGAAVVVTDVDQSRCECAGRGDPPDNRNGEPRTRR